MRRVSTACGWPSAENQGPNSVEGIYMKGQPGMGYQSLTGMWAPRQGSSQHEGSMQSEEDEPHWNVNKSKWITCKV